MQIEEPVSMRRNNKTLFMRRPTDNAHINTYARIDKKREKNIRDVTELKGAQIHRQTDDTVCGIMRIRLS